jgi:hypothetical protein
MDSTAVATTFAVAADARGTQTQRRKTRSTIQKDSLHKTLKLYESRQSLFFSLFLVLKPSRWCL